MYLYALILYIQKCIVRHLERILRSNEFIISQLFL